MEGVSKTWEAARALVDMHSQGWPMLELPPFADVAGLPPLPTPTPPTHRPEPFAFSPFGGGDVIHSLLSDEERSLNSLSAYTGGDLPGCVCVVCVCGRPRVFIHSHVRHVPSMDERLYPRPSTQAVRTFVC
jgi:hypothetical protein